MAFEKVIGVEVHVELDTNTKIFCGCSTEFGGKPNSRVCPVCLGLPGALPSLNKEVVNLAIKTGLALNCDINYKCRMDRKNYFYVDSPKSYQITQHKFPICKEGYVEIEVEGIRKNIGIDRIHMEEDAGKLIHTEEHTLIDFNRAGVPLLEIVSKPDMKSSKEVMLFLKELKAILTCIKVSDCKMEEGSLRCDLNISIKEKGIKELGTRVEVKNLNSFKHIEKVVEYEFIRQLSLIDIGEKVLQETRRWNDNKKITESMRSKEDEKDYRYFPEGDLMNINILKEWVEKEKMLLLELPTEKIQRYINDYRLEKDEAEKIVSDIDISIYFEEATKVCREYKEIYNWITGDIFAYLREKNISIKEYGVSSSYLGEIINLITEGKISNNIGKRVLNLCLEENKSPNTIIIEKGLIQNNNRNDILDIVKNILENNKENINLYKSGKSNLFSWFVGQVMKESSGKANPVLVKEILERELN
ncbi:Asp-tRNA(Asn)/Glu-tRNA(Gln) amidotransferase subunit GatB [Hathewaya histolytica]|uniref:Asp-tRNA(Asn)/Glu-tRNA(Gln) amidotransferase subunit GatB n=1 Tax=Hathewaya histolytica TaxID=1498 RepID=UPI003B66F948